MAKRLPIFTSKGFRPGISMQASRCVLMGATLMLTLLSVPTWGGLRSAAANEPPVVPSLLHASDLRTSDDSAQLASGARVSQSTVPAPVDAAALKGWDYLFWLLVSQGVDPSYLASLLADPRMPARETLFFSLKPRESAAMYRLHNTARARQHALSFYRSHYRYFKEAARKFGVPEEVILSILQVETKCGTYTGKSKVFFRLARLASAAAPENIEDNYRLKRVKDRQLQISAVEARAKWLEEEFLPHTLATIALAERLGIHPLEVTGSGAGAIGLPQFLPGNVDRFGVDGNGDLQVDLFEPADAVHSVANFLLNHGWEPHVEMPVKRQREAIWGYNRSDSYVSTILAMANALKPEMKKIGLEIEESFRRLARD